MPLHWLYGAEKINGAIGAKSDNPEFFHTPSSPYYSTEAHPGHYGLGQVSPYGEELLCLLNHMAKHKGEFGSPDAFADDLLAWGGSFGGRPNGCTRKFVEQRKAGAKYPECGADDSQASCFIKAVVVTVRYFGKPELMQKVEEAIRTHQNNDLAVLYGQTAARMLERVILGETVLDVLTKPDESLDRDVQHAYEFAKEFKSKPIWEFVDILGGHLKLEKPVFATSCALPSAFIMSNWILERDQTFEGALRENIRVGGDNCSRAVLLGALTAASSGTVPGEWKSKVSEAQAYEKLTDILVSARMKE